MRPAESNSMSLIQAQQAAVAGSLRQSSTPSTDNRSHRTTQDEIKPGVSSSQAAAASRASGRPVAKAPDQDMNASSPDDADRNLDFDALVSKYEKKIFN